VIYVNYKVLSEFHSNGSLPKSCNASFIALVPKGDYQQGLGDFRPISIIVCLYKAIAKVLVGRLKKVMGKLVSENQFAFLGERNMLDGVVVINEVVDEAHRMKKPCFVFKVDFEKAYNSFSWKYLF